MYLSARTDTHLLYFNYRTSIGLQRRGLVNEISMYEIHVRSVFLKVCKHFDLRIIILSSMSAILSFDQPSNREMYCGIEGLTLKLCSLCIYK